MFVVSELCEVHDLRKQSLLVTSGLFNHEHTTKALLFQCLTLQKVTFTLEHDMKALKWSTGIALLVRWPRRYIGVGCQIHAPAAFDPGNWPGTYCRGGWVGPRWSGRVRKTWPPPGFFFVFSCTLYFIRTCLFVLIVLHFAFLSLLTTQNRNIHAAGGNGIRSPDRPAHSE